MDISSENNPKKRSKQSKVAVNMDDLAIFFIPSLEIVGSTKNQCPIIIKANIPLINVIGRIFIIKFPSNLLNN